MSEYQNDIERYLNGSMTPAERHAFEKRALEDPFLAEALEGAEQLTAPEFAEDVKALNEEILTEQFIERQAASSMPTASKASAKTQAPDVIKTGASIWIWTGRVAAGMVIILVSAYLIWQFTQSVDEPSTLALEKTEGPAAPLADQDSASVETSVGEQPVSDVTERRQKDVSTIQSSSKTLAEAKDDKVEAKQEQPAEEIHHEAEIAQAKPVEVPVKSDELALEKDAARDLAFQKETADDAKKKAVSRAAGAPAVSIKVIRGKVTSAEDNSALPGINVVVKGTTMGTVTDVSGNYQIETPAANPTLVYSFIGLQTQEVKTENTNEVNVQMPMDVTQLSEVVVTGYGTSSRNEVYAPTVDLAHPESGNKAFKQYLEQSMQYPEEAKSKKISGRVVVEFFVETNGALSGFNVVRSVDGGCDEELIRLIQAGPKWIPTKKDGLAIRDKVRVGFRFSLPKN